MSGRDMGWGGNTSPSVTCSSPLPQVSAPHLSGAYRRRRELRSESRC